MCQLVTAGLQVSIEPDRIGQGVGRSLVAGHTLCHAVSRGMGHRLLTDLRGRGLLAAAQTRHGSDLHIQQIVLQLAQQTVAPGQAAAQAVADPHRDARRNFSVFQNLEVVVKGSDLKHLNHGQPHLSSQRHDVAFEQAVKMVVQHMQVLDQQVTTVAVLGW